MNTCCWCGQVITYDSGTVNKLTGKAGFWRDTTTEDTCCVDAPESDIGQFLHEPTPQAFVNA